MATVLDEKKQAVNKLASPSNIYPGNQLPGKSGFSSAPAVTGATAPKSATAAPAAAGFSYMDNMKSVGDDIQRTWDAGNYGEAIGKTVAGTVGGITTPVIDGVANGASGVLGFAKGLVGWEDSSATTPSVAVGRQQPVANAAPSGAKAMASFPASTQGSAPLSPGIRNNVGIAPQSASAPAQTNQIADGVYQHGRGQYSDQTSGMGMPAGFTGQPSAQNQRAAASLASMNSPVLAEQQGGVPAFAAPAVAHSGNDWAARQRLKNMETSASSIMNTQRWGGKNAQHNPAVQNFIDAQRADLTAQGKVPDMQLKTNEINAGLQRTAMAEAGADRRSQGQLGLGMGQLALGAERNQLDAQRINSDERLRAPQIRAAERLGQMQEAYINAKTPQEQAAIAAQMRAYSGKDEQADRFTVVPGGQEWDATAGAMRNVPARVLNNRSGQFVEQAGQQQAQQYVKGTVYEDAKGIKQRWNGTAFEAL